jgi:hypothetical protein
MESGEEKEIIPLLIIREIISPHDFSAAEFNHAVAH